MSSSPDPGDKAKERPVHTRRLRWWIAAITFVAGFVFGVLTVGLLNATTPDFASRTGQGGSPIPTLSLAPTPGGSVPVVAEARVNAACLAVINDAQDTYAVLTVLPQAVSDVDLQQLDDIVRSLQPILDRLGPDLQNCRVDTDVVSNSTDSTASPPSTPQPTGTPTR